MSGEHVERSGENYAACQCGALPHEPCREVVYPDATPQYFGPAEIRPRTPHRGRMLLGRVKPWRYA